MKAGDVAELWVRFASAAKTANEALREDVEKYGYAETRAAVRHSWDTCRRVYGEAASDLWLWASRKDREAIAAAKASGLDVEYEAVRPWPPSDQDG